MASIEKDPLAQIPLFAGLTDAARAELSLLFKPQSYEPGQHIVWVGEPGQEFMIIRKGRVSICLPDEAGKELCLASLGPGQFFGEISLLDGGPRTATARAEIEVELLCLGRDEFMAFLHKHPSVAVRMMTTLGQRQRETNEKLRGIKNANEVIAENATAGQRAAERVASTFAHSGWVLGNLIFFSAWIVVNVILYHLPSKRHFDEPPTFFTLGFIITLEAILLSMFVLNAQKRQAERDRIRSDLEYQVNLKNHLQVMQLHQKVDRLEQQIAEATGTLPPVRPPRPDMAA